LLLGISLIAIDVILLYTEVTIHIFASLCNRDNVPVFLALQKEYWRSVPFANPAQMYLEKLAHILHINRIMVSGGVDMTLTRLNPLNDNTHFMYEMDPVFEDYLARELSSWPQAEEIELALEMDELLELDEMEAERLPRPTYVLALA
jgi:hypothetical protein